MPAIEPGAGGEKRAKSSTWLYLPLSLGWWLLSFKAISSVRIRPLAWTMSNVKNNISYRFATIGPTSWQYFCRETGAQLYIYSGISSLHAEWTVYSCKHHAEKDLYRYLLIRWFQLYGSLSPWAPEYYFFPCIEWCNTYFDENWLNHKWFLTDSVRICVDIVQHHTFTSRWLNLQRIAM